MELTTTQKNRIWDAAAEIIATKATLEETTAIAIVRDRLCNAQIRPGGRIHLADLFETTNGNTALALLELEQKRAIALYRLDNPAEITAQDKAAAIDLGNRNLRHFIRFV